MSDLIEKLKAATGPDRELDARLWAIKFELDWWEPQEGGTAIKVYDPNSGLKTLIGFIDPGENSRNFTLIEERVPEYTASIDAALALVGEVLPGWRYGLRTAWDGEGDGHYAWLASPDYQVLTYHAGGEDRSDHISGIREFGVSASPAIAILIALLTAIDKQNTETVA